MRFDLSDKEWSVLEPLMPKSRKSARPHDRRIINAIFYVLRTGIPWRDLPERYGPYTSAYNRFSRVRRQAGAQVRASSSFAEIQSVDECAVTTFLQPQQGLFERSDLRALRFQPLLIGLVVGRVAENLFVKALHRH
jgi:transposase